MKAKSTFYIMLLATFTLLLAACGTDDGNGGDNGDETFTLTVNIGGEGDGTVTSQPEGIDADSNASGDFDADATVTLTATAGEESTFAGWTGDCTGDTCSVTMDSDKTVTATFNEEGDTTPPPTPPTDGEGVAIADSSDDSEEFLGDGSLEAGSTFPDNDDLDFTVDGNRGSLIAGLRFVDLEIPAGATITDAYIQFTVSDDEDGLNSNPAAFVVDAQNDVNPEAFTDDDGDISGRTLTGSPVEWTPAPWLAVGNAGEAQRVDVTSLVSAIVSNADWNEEDNAIVFVISDDPNSDDSGVRTAYAIDGNEEGAARLVVTLEGEEDGDDGETGGDDGDDDDGETGGDEDDGDDGDDGETGGEDDG